ncbi:hypothetical protein VOLCADRAFT_119579 [Volvox carteri f. nagariensis]|uniref:Endonuclease/exonuclease/phosphatase domain-containing protein n=1 Tax=Volvox carteri f. nagariensis TaxID=3068 RepID=D8UEE7_VOLCA|nr:uncharacterized protein VOLCADRAFT_119579 [Volvox carteri f. nagariensis]EFJ41831.1 hypothetical protein VOLCADRAFT_119579 [Volvox carteri f. nagariensis]|eukprot:XP_002957029.1 hypothetical protein VOLCADRAFT_119579 [Volvox carteri f. nagariensis]
MELSQAQYPCPQHTRRQLQRSQLALRSKDCCAITKTSSHPQHVKLMCISLEFGRHCTVTRAQAHYFAHKLYGDVPRHYLDWHHRLRLLVEEIRYWAPDVVCLQEVQHYNELEPELRAAGRSDRLRAHGLERLDFAPLGLEDNLALLMGLGPRAEAAEAAGLDRQVAEALTSVRLLVATTHITFDPAKGDVKLGQGPAAGCTAAVEGRRRKAPGGPWSVAAVAAPTAGAQQQQPQQPLQTLAIITGDFNSTAGSPLYQFVSRGALDLGRTNRKKLSGQLHGVCHTQYKPVREVKQLHAQLAAAAAASGPDAVDGSTAAAADSNATANAAVTALAASPPGTPPSTPLAAGADAGTGALSGSKHGHGSSTATTTPVGAIQRLAAAAMDSAAAAVSACTAAAVTAVTKPALACSSDAARALDHFLHSSSTAAGGGGSGSHHRHMYGGGGGVERWSEKELRCAMGDQYDAAAVQRAICNYGGAAAAVFPPSQVLATSASGPVTNDGGTPAETQALPPLSSPRLGRQLHPPLANRGKSAAAASTLPCRSLDSDPNVQVAPSLDSSPSGPLVVRHPLRLKSSYMEVARAEPAFTSLHSGFMGTVDFIWYTADAILQQQPQQQQAAAAVATSAPCGGCVEGEMAPAAAAAPGLPAAAAPAAGSTTDTAVGAVPCGCLCGPPAGRAESELPHAPASGPHQHHHQQQQQQQQQQCRRGQPQQTIQPCQQQQQPPPLHSGGCSVAAAAAATSASADGTTGDATAAATASPARRFQLVPVAVLLPPDLELLPRGLPAAGWGSDHISVMTQFELRLM